MSSAPRRWHTLQRPKVATRITSALTFPLQTSPPSAKRSSPISCFSLTEIKTEAAALEQIKELEELAPAGLLPWVARAPSPLKIAFVNGDRTARRSHRTLQPPVYDSSNLQVRRSISVTNSRNPRSHVMCVVHPLCDCDDAARRHGESEGLAQGRPGDVLS